MELTTKTTEDKMKIKTAFSAAREGTSQMIWDRVAVVVDENDEEMMNKNKHNHNCKNHHIYNSKKPHHNQYSHHQQQIIQY